MPTLSSTYSDADLPPTFRVTHVYSTDLGEEGLDLASSV